MEDGVFVGYDAVLEQRIKVDQTLHAVGCRPSAMRSGMLVPSGSREYCLLQRSGLYIAPDCRNPTLTIDARDQRSDITAAKAVATAADFTVLIRRVERQHARDGLVASVVCDGRQHQVAGIAALSAVVHGVHVADFTNQDHVRDPVAARPSAPPELSVSPPTSRCEHVGGLVTRQELDRIFAVMTFPGDSY